ncbi:MAG: molybdate ABC transporter substrate-binding protein [Fibrobacterota bacterium]
MKIPYGGKWLQGALLAVNLCVVSCNHGQAEKRTKKELIFFCGAGLRSVADSLIAEFKKTAHDVAVQANYSGSGQLLGQITTNRKGDLFMPGAEFYAEKAIESGLADGSTRRDVAYFIPVIMVRKGNPHGVKSVLDLKKEGIRIGLGDKRSAAVGINSLTILNNYALPYEAIRENVVYHSGTVNELGAAIELNTVDAVILWDTNARHFSETGDVVKIPREKNAISTVPIVMLTSSKYPKEAKRFIQFVASEKGKNIFHAKGYSTALEN